jgi:hypothetical protein
MFSMMDEIEHKVVARFMYPNYPNPYAPRELRLREV